MLGSLAKKDYNMAAKMHRFTLRRESITVIWRRALSFENFDLDKLIIERLKSRGIVSPTQVQEKSLGIVLKRKNAIINAETGSGKTLCYLLPIMNQLQRHRKEIKKYPFALILLPSVELCHQVADVFKNLADPGLVPCIVHRDSKLYISDIYPVVMATPNALLSYNLKILNCVQTLVTDEADFMVTSGGKDVWTILNFFNERKNKVKKVRNNVIPTKSTNDDNLPRCTERQFIFAAATLPSRGRKAASNVLREWLPDAELITTDTVHNTVPTVKMHYIEVEQRTKLSQLLRTLNIVAGFLEADDDISCKFERVKLEELKVLVFANTVSAVDKAFKFLTSTDTKVELDHHWPKRVAEGPRRTVSTSMPTEGDEHLTLGKGHQTVDAEKSMGERHFWHQNCGNLHKNIPLQERMATLERFRGGEIKVLVCTDVASRGLDIPDVSHVIQLDFAPNSAIVLHRAGRTARTGTAGSVISFVADEDEDLARVLRSRTTELEGYQQTFSRNRMFRRRVKANTLPMAERLGAAK